MKANLTYLVYLLKHKWFVAVAGRRLGVSLWRLLIHDWSKLSRAEWSPYVDTFHRHVKSQYAFEAAWLHHIHRNPHHWNHWVLHVPGKAAEPPVWVAIEMPEAYAREMVADWAGAGRAITGRWELAEWYAKNREKMLLHPGTRAFVTQLVEDTSALCRA